MRLDHLLSKEHTHVRQPNELLTSRGVLSGTQSSCWVLLGPERMTRCWVSEASDAALAQTLSLLGGDGVVALVGFWLFDFLIVDASIHPRMFPSPFSVLRVRWG